MFVNFINSLNPRAMRPNINKIFLIFSLLILILGVIYPIFASKAGAAQLTSRSITVSTAKPSATSVTYTYAFTTPATGNIGALIFQACTTAVGTCTAPTGLTINAGSAEASRSGWTSSGTFSRTTSTTNDCVVGANTLCLTRTAASETAGARTLGWGSATNPSTTGTFFVRITTYSDAAYTTSVDQGTVATSTTATLTISARIQEVLNFCIGTTSVDDATTSPGSDCSAISGTAVDLGTLDSGYVNISPVASGHDGNNVNGVAMLRTNAASGASVTYKSIQASGTNHLGTLRVSGATCQSGAATNDQCIDAVGTTQSTIAAGTENFGMTVAAINCGSANYTGFTCDFSAGNTKVTRNADYDGNGGNTYASDADQVAGTTSNGYAWDETGTSDTIAASTSAVSDESMILKFAATPDAITPTGSYTAQTDFIVVATY